jgi:hypothetical protein
MLETELRVLDADSGRDVLEGEGEVWIGGTYAL